METTPTWKTLGRYAVAVGAKPVLNLATARCECETADEESVHA